MAQKKTNSKKPLIILCVVVIVAVLAFLIYDEVQSSNYLNQLNQQYRRPGIGQRRRPQLSVCGGCGPRERQLRDKTRHLSARR